VPVAGGCGGAGCGEARRGSKAQARRERACASSAPGRAPPHLPAPLPREFVKQISLIAPAEEFVGEKSRGNSPPLGHPFPTPPGSSSGRAGPSPSPPSSVGCSCGVSSGHPGPRSTSSQPGHPRPLPCCRRGLPPDAVTRGTAACPRRLAFPAARLSPPGSSLRPWAAPDTESHRISERRR